jgi:hypothetical protein
VGGSIQRARSGSRQAREHIFEQALAGGEPGLGQLTDDLSGGGDELGAARRSHGTAHAFGVRLEPLPRGRFANACRSSRAPGRCARAFPGGRAPRAARATGRFSPRPSVAGRLASGGPASACALGTGVRQVHEHPAFLWRSACSPVAVGVAHGGHDCLKDRFGGDRKIRIERGREALR